MSSHYTYGSEVFPFWIKKLLIRELHIFLCSEKISEVKSNKKDHQYLTRSLRSDLYPIFEKNI